jgi:hypothetical protein
MPNKNEDLPAVARPKRPVLSLFEILVIIASLVIGALLAVPAMKGTYIEAVLSGKCAHDPKLPVCNPRGGRFTYHLYHFSYFMPRSAPPGS